MVTQLKPNKHSQPGSGNREHMMERIVSPLLAVYDIMVGPPMSERQRNRLAIAESKVATARESSIFSAIPWR